MAKQVNNIDKFLEQMRDWKHFYPTLTGCKKLHVENSNFNLDYLSTNNCILEDLRCCGNIYSISHETGAISEINIQQIKENTKFKDQNFKKLKNNIDTKTLIYRYYWIIELFIDCESLATSNIYRGWNNNKEINLDYKKEKKNFKNDPYLALYWLLHFGFTLDKRFEEVKQLVEKYKLGLELEFINTTLEFFEETDENFTFEIKGDSDLFLKRRNYLISTAQTSEKENFESWWKSVTTNSSYGKDSLNRIIDFKDKLKNSNKWHDFDNIPNIEKENINLISYIYVCNPTTQNKQKYADIFLQELKENIDILIDQNKSFAQKMLWDIKNMVSDKELLKEVSHLISLKEAE